MQAIKGTVIACVVIVVLVAIGFGTKYAGLWGDTYIERKVYEESYQRSESLKARIATDEAVLAEIEVQLSNTALDASTRTNLEAQARAARVRIHTAKSQQQ
jgi:hypothetical protein